MVAAVLAALAALAAAPDCKPAAVLLTRGLMALLGVDVDACRRCKARGTLVAYPFNNVLDFHRVCAFLAARRQSDGVSAHGPPPDPDPG